MSFTLIDVEPTRARHRRERGIDTVAVAVLVFRDFCDSIGVLGEVTHERRGIWIDDDHSWDGGHLSHSLYIDPGNSPYDQALPL